MQMALTIEKFCTCHNFPITVVLLTVFTSSLVISQIIFNVSHFGQKVLQSMVMKGAELWNSSALGLCQQAPPVLTGT